MEGADYQLAQNEMKMANITSYGGDLGLCKAIGFGNFNTVDETISRALSLSKQMKGASTPSS